MQANFCCTFDKTINTGTKGPLSDLSSSLWPYLPKLDVCLKACRSGWLSLMHHCWPQHKHGKQGSFAEGHATPSTEMKMLRLLHVSMDREHLDQKMTADASVEADIFCLLSKPCQLYPTQCKMPSAELTVVSSHKSSVTACASPLCNSSRAGMESCGVYLSRPHLI